MVGAAPLNHTDPRWVGGRLPQADPTPTFRVGRPSPTLEVPLPSPAILRISPDPPTHWCRARTLEFAAARPGLHDREHINLHCRNHSVPLSRSARAAGRAPDTGGLSGRHSSPPHPPPRFWRPEVRDQGAVWWGSVRAPFPAYKRPPSRVPSPGGGREPSCPFPFLQAAHLTGPLRAPSRPSHFQKPPPNPITLGAGLRHPGLGETQIFGPQHPSRKHHTEAKAPY